MQHILTDFTTPMEPFVFWENAFNDSELDWLRHRAINTSTPGLVGGGSDGRNDPGVRRSDVSWLNSSQETKWVYEKISYVVSSLNAKFYKFDLIGMGESFQLSNYDSSKSGTYGWHIDFSPEGPSRKLSLVLQLTDPSEYEGGNLQILNSSQPITIPKKRGLIVAFPSWTLHQVTPVTMGNRQSLVSWITGPMFK